MGLYTHKTVHVTQENTHACTILFKYSGRGYAEFMTVVVSEERVGNRIAFGEHRIAFEDCFWGAKSFDSHINWNVLFI